MVLTHVVPAVTGDVVEEEGSQIGVNVPDVGRIKLVFFNTPVLCPGGQVNPTYPVKSADMSDAVCGTKQPTHIRINRQTHTATLLYVPA